MLLVRRAQLFSLLAAFLVLFAAPAAFAETPTRPFGASGEVAIEDLVAVRSSGLGFLGVLGPASSSFGPVAPPALYGIVGYENGEGEIQPGAGVKVTASNLWVAPSLDVFVTNRVSLGLTAGIARGWGEQRLSTQEELPRERGRSYTLAIAPRLGYVFPLGAGFSLWPRLGVGFTGSRADTAQPTSGGAERTTSTAGGIRWSGGVDLGIIFRPTRHLFFSATPEVSVVYGIAGQMIEGTTVYVGQSTRMRFAGTLGMGVLLGT